MYLLEFQLEYLSAAGLGKLIDLEEIKLKTNIKNPFKVIIQPNSGCSSFAHCYIEGIENTESPKWLKDKLISVGMNPISIVVDITNYIMLDLNRPLHAYDADKIDRKGYRDWETDRKSTRLNSSHSAKSRMPSSA